MSALQIFLFGNIRLVYPPQNAEIKLTHTVQTLLAYLLLYRHHSHARETLAGCLWPDYSEQRARSCLSTTLWRLHSALASVGAADHYHDLLITSASEVGVNQAGELWLDVAVFEDRVHQAVTQPGQPTSSAAAQALEQALPLYIDDLLAGFYDDWALRERERLRALYLDSLTYLMHFYEQQGAYERSLTYGQQILRHDPLHEEIQRAVMQLYLASGQPALAVRQYQSCCRILEAELGILPMPETQALYAQIISAAGRQPLLPPPPTTAVTLQQALRQLRQARQNFEEAQQKLQRAIQLVEQLVTDSSKEG